MACGVAEGLISYIRTDSPSLDAAAAKDICQAVQRLWGAEYLADAPNLYK